MNHHSNHSLRLLLTVCLSSGIQLAWAQGGQRNSNAVRLRQIQQQYQKLIRDMSAEEANIQQKRADYGQKSIDAIRDTIEDLIAIVKSTPPTEDPGTDLTHYVEFLGKLKGLEDTTFKILNGIADSNTSLTEKDLRLQKLNQNLVNANSVMRDLTDISNPIRNPDIKLHELPYSDKDWTALDQAIEQMRKEDSAFNPAAPAAVACYPLQKEMYKEWSACNDSCNVAFNKIPKPIMADISANLACMSKCEPAAKSKLPPQCQ